MSRIKTILPWLFVGPFVVTMTAMIFACDLVDPSPDATINYPEGIDCTNLSSASPASSIYRCKCASCHGVEGEPVTDEVIDIRGYSVRNDFDATLSTGPGAMPSFPELDEVQKTKLFEYVRDSL